MNENEYENASSDDEQSQQTMAASNTNIVQTNLSRNSKPPDVQDPNDDEIDNPNTFKPIFLQDQDMLGSVKVTKPMWVTHVEIYKTICAVVDPAAIKGIPRFRSMWRIYMDNEIDRLTLIIPQCSILFILYINDLPLSISNCNTDMYADDSTIHISGKNISDIQTIVQEDLNRIELWYKDDNMFINCNKTKCITAGKKQKLAFQNEELYLTINSEQLQHSACEKLLGIKIDSNLNLKNQIDQICS